jgi:hypothetical protein
LALCGENSTSEQFVNALSMVDTLQISGEGMGLIGEGGKVVILFQPVE